MEAGSPGVCWIDVSDRQSKEPGRICYPVAPHSSRQPATYLTAFFANCCTNIYCFLRMVVHTIVASILVVSVSNISTCMQWLASWGVQCVEEADCKDQRPV